MEQIKTSKKALRSLINDSMQEAIAKLELPESGKKVKKLLHRNSKRLAEIYVHAIKRENKKKRKTEKFMEDAVKGKTKKKEKKSKEVRLEEAVGA